MKLPNKLPVEVWIVTFDYTKQLLTGDKITARNVESKAGDLVVVATSFADTTVSFRISGGTIGTLCELWVEAITQDGETLGETCIVSIIG